MFSLINETRLNIDSHKCIFIIFSKFLNFNRLKINDIKNEKVLSFSMKNLPLCLLNILKHQDNTRYNLSSYFSINFKEEGILDFPIN